MLSVGGKIKQIAGLAHTQDVNEKTSEFIDDMVLKTNNGAQTGSLSDAQLDWINDIHRKHFGDAQG